MEGPTSSQLQAHQIWGLGAVSSRFLEDSGNFDSYVRSIFSSLLVVN